MTFRIYTEATHLRVARRLAVEHFAAYTVLRGSGYWRGAAERSVVFEVHTRDRTRVFAFARALKKAQRQRAVLVVALRSVGTLV